MNKDMAQFQSELSNYVVLDSANYWPVWLVLAGVLLVCILGVLGLHYFLRVTLGKKASSDTEHRVYLYSKAVRLWHWCNALLFILLLASGLMNHFGVFSYVISMALVNLHNVCGYLFIICWLCFILVNLFGGNGKHYCIKRQGWIGRAKKQAHFYMIDIIKGDDHPFPATENSKFNPLQQTAYLGVMLGLVPCLIITGLLCLNPEWMPSIKSWILTVHLMLAVIGLFFMVAHIYLCTTGKKTSDLFKCMIDGYHRD